jgi:hypothetical protein
MKIISLLLLTLSVNAFASEKKILVCTTPGDALNAVELIQTGKKNIIRVSSLDDSSEDFISRSSFANIVKKEADTLVASTNKSIEFGGAVTDSVLLRVLPGQTKAYLAKDGVVYYLTCFKN